MPAGINRPARSLSIAIGAVALASAALVGCDVPRDPEGTLDRVRGGTMRVGVTPDDPWVRLEGKRPGGVEVALVERFAAGLDARVDWVEGSEEELIAALKERELDLVIGGLTKESPWKKEAALTRPYLTTRVVVAVPQGASVPDDLDGVRVAVESGQEAAGLLERKTDATVVQVEELEGVRGPAAVHDWLVDDLGLEATDVELKREKHVMAVPLGENAWMVELERFLLDRTDEIEELLEREARP